MFAEHLGGRPDDGPAGLDLAALRRVRLDARSWLDVGRSAFRGHAALFDLLLGVAPWRQRERQMYDRDVLEPRLVAGWSGDDLAALPAPVEAARTALSAHYGTD